MAMDKLFHQPSQRVLDTLNESFKDYQPGQLILATAGISLATAYIYGQLTHKVPWPERIKKYFFRLARKLPQVKAQIEAETEKVRSSFCKEMLEPTNELPDLLELPDSKMTTEQVLELTKTYLGCGEFDWKQGTFSGTVYNGSEELTELITKVYGMAAWTNPLHPDAFPGIRKMEAEIVRMCCDLFNGGPTSCGCVTSGGTESIILAIKAYRDHARENKGVENPNIIVPITAHAAFDKGADLLDIQIKHVPVDPVTQRVNLKKMKSMINSSTCMLLGSAPQFPHGSIDDIEGIAELGLQYDIPVHVDACLGGFLIPFMKDAGYPLKPFDFSVPGVTSISCDTHKYGFAPKGSSVILYSKPEYRHMQWFTFPDWPGGIYATATISGSRAGGIVAACWAALMSFGKQGYVESTRAIIDTTRYIEKGVRDIEGIHIMGVPEVCVISLGSDQFNIYGLSDGLKKRGWNLNALQFPSCIHLCVTYLQTQDGVADKFINDVKEITAACLADPKACDVGSAAVYGMAQSLPDRSIVDQITRAYLDSLYAIKSLQ